MTENNPPNNQEKSEEDLQNEFFQRARKGVLKYLEEKGGKLNLAELHDYSLSKFFIQHQRFSKMMETYVNDGYVDYDHESQDVSINDAGRQFVSS